MNATETNADVATLRNDIVALARRLRQSARTDSETWTDLMILGVVERSHGQATPTQIAAELGLRSSNLAQALNTLAERGLLVRRPDAADKRRVRLALTDAGATLVATTRAQRDRWLADAMHAHLTPAERAQLIAASALLRRLAHAAESDLR